jgi:hypothetical protein
MAVPLATSGGLLVRLGHLFGGVIDTIALRGGNPTTRVLSGANFAKRCVNTIDPDFAASVALPQPIDGLMSSLSSFQSALGSILTDFQNRAKNTIIAMVNIDTQAASPLGSLSQLTTGMTLQQALAILASQMVTSSDSVQAATVVAGAQTAVGTPIGNAIIVLSLKTPTGLLLQLPFPETITFKVTGDVQSGSVQGNEPFLVLGQAAVSDQMSMLWPGGSGCSVNLNAIDGSKSNSTNNLLQNSDFATATTGNIPDNWTIGIGAAGTDIFQTSSGTYTPGGGALQFTGTGSALLDAVTQSFGTTPVATVGGGGTITTLKPDVVYHVNLWLKCSATPSAGVVELALTDGSAYPGVVLLDDQGNSNLFTKSLTAVSTSYVNVQGSFRTPAVLPTTTPVAKLRVRLSTAIDSGKSVYIGRLSLTPAAQLYPGGPFCSIHSGSTRVINGLAPDTWTIAITNTYSTSGSGLLQQCFERFFSMRSLGVQLPYANSPTQLDTLIS